jgi:hypothetical protein
MATQNHVTVPNFAPLAPTGGSVFNQIWKLSRALKKAGWKYLASYDGTKDTSADPELDRWGVGTVSNLGGSGATVVAPTRGRSTVTGLSGIVAADKGRFLHLNGATPANNHHHQIEEVLSATSVKIDARTFAVAAESGMAWEIRDPLGDVYPITMTAANCWILLRGPSMLKIPIASAPTPNPTTGATFIRGENVLQTTTGAQGEILGFVFDGVSSGYLVINPRVRGTGSGVYGWDSTYTITGGSSGATVVQSAATVEYRHELVLGKNGTATHGVIWLGCFDPAGEASDMLSASARLTAATSSPPGGNSDFPTYAWVVLGTSAAIGGAHTWVYGTSTANGNAQIMCADAIEEENWSSDGSWTVAMATLSGTTGLQCTAGDHTGFSFQRCDDSEDGDLAPYVTFSPEYFNRYAVSRTAVNTFTSSVAHLFSTGSSFAYSASYSCLRGWRGRGSAGDSASLFSGFAPAVLAEVLATPLLLCEKNPAWIERQRTSLVATKVREPVWVVNADATLNKMRKGTMRWFGVVQGGESGDTYDSKKWVQLSTKVAPLIAGPWDGSTTPILWV